MNKYPYTEYNIYNLDWIIKKIRELNDSMTDFEALHSIQFGGDWDISKQYEAWTIVSDPLTHNGYLSLKPVPNNVQITNTEYWLKIADYTTGLAAVNERVDDLETWQAETETDLNNIETAINDTIPDAISQLRTDTEAEFNTLNNTTIPAIEAEIDMLQSKRVLIFGDSYFMNNPIGGGQSVKALLESMVENSPFTFDVKSDGREGFSIAAPDSFLYDVQNYTSVFNPDEVTDVLFVGGYNDRVNTKSAIEAGMSITFDEVRTKYPNAKISVGHFGWSCHLSGQNRADIIYSSIPAYANAALYGAAFMTNSQYTMHYYELYIDDYIHPSEDGRREIAKQILQYLRTGTCDVHYPVKSVQYNATGGPVGLWTNTVYTVSSKLDNDIVTIYLPNGNIVYSSSPFSLDTSMTALLGLDYPTYPGYRLHFIGLWEQDRNIYQFPLVGNFRTSSGFSDYSNCSFCIKQGSLMVADHKLNAAGTGYGHVQNITELNLNGQAITIPSLCC